MTIGREPIPTVESGPVPWLSVEQMREVDRVMVDKLGVSLVRMMENAGRNLAELARYLLGGDARGRSIVVLAGPGGERRRWPGRRLPSGGCGCAGDDRARCGSGALRAGSGRA